MWLLTNRACPRDHRTIPPFTWCMQVRRQSTLVTRHYAVESPECGEETSKLVGDRQRTDRPQPRAQYLSGRWPTRRKLMGLLVCCWNLAPAPPRGPSPNCPKLPQWHRTHSLVCTLLESVLPALYGSLVPVYPPGTPPPRSVLPVCLSQATTSPSWFFCPATHRACGSSSYPNPAALPDCTAPERHPILQNLSRRERGVSKAHRRPSSCILASLTFTNITDLPIIYQHTLAIHHSTLSLVAPWPCSLLFASSFFFFLLLVPIPPLPHSPFTINKQVGGPAGDGTEPHSPKHRMPGSPSNPHHHHHHHPPLCQS